MADVKQKPFNKSRALYDQLVAQYPKERYKNVIITDSFLLLMKSIQGTFSTITFDVLVNQATGTTANNIENRLQITDRFVVLDHAVCLMKAGTTVAATQAEISVATPSTYPNPNVFTAANEARNLEVIYNSKLSITIDSTVYYQGLDVRRFYRVPTSQLGVAVSTVAVTGVLPRDGWDSLNYAFAPVTTNFEFSGIGNNQIVLNMPDPIATGGTNSQNFVLYYARGFQVQNVNQRQ